MSDSRSSGTLSSDYGRSAGDEAAAKAAPRQSHGVIARCAATVVAGTIGGLLAVVLSIAAANLVVAGQIPSYAPLLIGVALLSAAILNLVASAASSMKSAIAGVQEIPCVAMSAIVGATVGATSGGGDKTLTVLIALSLATLLSGACLVILGVFRRGAFVRFIPYPVIGGFLAGTGWLMVLGGLEIVLAAPAGTVLSPSKLDPDVLLHLGLTGVFVLALVVTQWKYPGPTVVPSVVLAGIALFNIVVLAIGLTHEDLQDWLVALPESGRFWYGSGIGGFDTVDWQAVGAGMLEVPILVVLTAIGLLLNATSIELERQRDVDLNRELRSMGTGNVLAGVTGGLPGYPAVSLTLLAARLGADTRFVGVVAAAAILVVLLFGFSVLDIFPTLVIGGLLIWMGGVLMLEWLAMRWRLSDGWDLAIVFSIFVIIVSVGFAQGILAGVVAALLLFVFEYAQVDVVRDEIFGDEYRGALVGSALPRDWLDRYGKSILIIRLTGFLFFGTANRLRQQIQERLRRLSSDGPGFLVLDFGRVAGIDSSARSSFRRLDQIAAQSGISIVLTGLKEATQRTLLKDGHVGMQGSSVRFESDLERGVKWCEDALLAGIAGGQPHIESRPIAEMLTELVEDGAAAETIGRYCQRVVVDAGQILMAEGEPSQELYLIERGHATVEVNEDRSATRIHLASVGPGDIIGEITFYLGDQRSATVVATDEMVVWKFSSESMARLEDEAPDAALRLNKSMAAMLSGRLARANRHIGRLAD